MFSSRVNYLSQANEHSLFPPQTSTQPTHVSSPLLPSLQQQQQQHQHSTDHLVMLEMAQRNARERAMGLLHSVSKLDDVSDLIKMHEMQTALVKQRITSITSQQIAEAQRSMQLVQESRECASRVQHKFDEINELTRQTQLLVQNYSLVRETLMTLENVKLARTNLEKLLMLQDEIDEIQLLLEDDEGLVEAHERIMQLESIRDAAMLEVAMGDHMANRGQYMGLAEMESIFNRFFEKIDQVTTQFFNLVFGEYLEDVVNRAEMDPALVVRLAQIIEREEEQDQKKLQKLKSLEEQHGSQRSFNRSSINNAVKLKQLRMRCFESFDKSIREKFHYELEEAAVIPTQLEVLSVLMVDELERVERFVVPCFPDEVNIMAFFIRKHEEMLVNSIDTMTQDLKALPNSTKLRILRWIKDYHILVEDIIETPHSFTSKINAIEGDYVGNMTNSMIEWCQALVRMLFKSDIKTHLNENGRPFTASTVELFTMLNSQIGDIEQHDMTYMLLNVANSCRAIMSLYQDEMLKMADAHIKDLPLHIICALCNDGTQCNVYLEEFENRILEHVELKDFKNIGFVTCRKGFRSMGRVMVTHLCEILMNDTEIKFNEIFGKEWYSETDGHLIVQAIVNTFEDYFVNDFERDILEPEWLSLLTKLLIAKVIKRYLDQLLLKQHVSLQQDAGRRMLDDVRRLKQFFLEHDHDVGSAMIERSFRVLVIVGQYLSVRDEDDVAFELGQTLAFAPDFPLVIAEGLLMMRPDLNKTTRSQMIDMVHQTYKHHKEIHVYDKRDKQAGNSEEGSIFAEYASLVNYRHSTIAGLIGASGSTGQPSALGVDMATNAAKRVSKRLTVNLTRSKPVVSAPEARQKKANSSLSLLRKFGLRSQGAVDDIADDATAWQSPGSPPSITVERSSDSDKDRDGEDVTELNLDDLLGGEELALDL